MHYGRRSSRQRPNDAACSSRAPSVAREQPDPRMPIRPEPEDSHKVEEARHDGRRADGTKQSPQHRVDAGRGGYDRRIPAPNAAAAGRRSRMLAGFDPKADTQRASSVSAAARHLAPAGKRGNRLEARPLRRDGDRLRPHRRLRAAACRWQAPHVPCYRPRLEVHLRRVPRRANTTTGPAFLRSVVAFAAICSTASVANMASSSGSPRPIIPGPTVWPNG